MAISEAGRQKLREQIQITKPWLKSTGAKTAQGKLISSQNALKTGLYSQFFPLRFMSRELLLEDSRPRIREIIQNMQKTYDESDTAIPPRVWERLFEKLNSPDFLK